MSLVLRIRKHQHVDTTTFPPTNVVINCSVTPPYVANYVAGTIPQTWIEINDTFVEGLDKLELTFKEGENNSKVREKSSSSTISITGQYAQDIKDWILGTPCSILNYWDAQIYDPDCDITYQNFEMKPDNMEWCLDDNGQEECVVEMPLREVDNKKSSLQKVIITDDWQGWFNGKGGSNPTLMRDFPHTEVVIQNTPIQHGMTVGLWVFVKSFLTIPGTPIGIGGVLNTLIDIDKYINSGAGFGYFAPCIPIRELLQNALEKIGMTLDTSSPFSVGNELEFDTIFYPRGGEYHKRDNDSCESPSLKFKWNNRDLTTLEDFIIEICKVYKLNWQAVNNVLVFQFQKDKFSLAPIGNITQYEKLCKSFSFEKRKGYGDYRYTVDSADQRSNNVEIQYNDVVDYDGVANNELLEGKQDNRVQFAPTSFWGDGFGEDMLNGIADYSTIVAGVLNASIYIGFLVSMVSTTAGISTPLPTTCLAGPGVTVPATATGVLAISIAAITAALLVNVANVLIEVSNFRSRFAYDSCHRGAVHIFGTGELSMPRIIRIKSGNDLNNARPIEVNANSINPNKRYNVNSIPWKDQFNGGYAAKDWAFNFPLFFDANYFGELYNTYHETVDNGLFVSDTNQYRTLDIPLCCDNLQLLGVENEDNAVGKVITVNGEKIIIQEFIVNYETFIVTIKGKLIL